MYIVKENKTFDQYFGDIQPTLSRGWRGNFYKCADESSHPHWASWAPIGPELRTMSDSNPPSTPLSPERRRQLAAASVAAQFETIAAAAAGCVLIVGATALQIAAPSVAARAIRKRKKRSRQAGSSSARTSSAHSLSSAPVDGVAPARRYQ